MRIKKVMWVCSIETGSRSQHLCVVMVVLKSQIKVAFLYNCLNRLRSQTAASPLKAMTTFIVLRLLALRCKSFIVYENYYIQWLLLVFLVIFSASLSRSDDFVLFDSLDGNTATFSWQHISLYFSRWVSSDLVFRSYLETDCVYKSHKYSPHRVLEVRLAPAVQEGRGFQGSLAHHLYHGALDFPKDRDGEMQWMTSKDRFHPQCSLCLCRTSAE